MRELSRDKMPGPRRALASRGHPPRGRLTSHSSAELKGPGKLLILVGFGSVFGRFWVGFGQSWAPDRCQRPRLEKHFINQRKLTRETDSKAPNSAELKGPRKRLRIRQEIFEFESDASLKRRQTQPKIHGAVPTDRHTTVPNGSGPVSACFDDDPKLKKR